MEKPGQPQVRSCLVRPRRGIHQPNGSDGGSRTYEKGSTANTTHEGSPGDLPHRVVTLHAAAFEPERPRVSCVSRRRQMIRALERQLFELYRLDVTERELDISGIHLRLLEIGSGPPVLFLHGISSLAVHWAPLVPYLKRFRCLLLDLPGHGLSGNFDYRAVPLRQHAAELLSSIIAALGLESITLVGNSLGTQFAFFLALDQTRKVQAIIGMGEPATAFKGARPKGTLLVMAVPRLNRLVLESPSPAFIYRAAMADITGWHAVRSVPAALIEVGRLAGRLPGHAASVTSLMERLNRFATPRTENILTAAELGKITKPVFFVWGRRDRYLLPDAGSHWLRKMPNSSMEVIDAGHLPWFDRPAEAGRLVCDFLSGGTSQSGAP